MKICYIISTCDKYLDTRVKYQMDYLLKHVNKEDIYYLTSEPNIDKRQFGYGAPDTFETITWKYIYFIYNMNIENYDWYMFMDDDTFLFFNRFEKMLKNYDYNENYYIGKELDHIKNTHGLYMSGGAGYAISRPLYSLMKDYVKNLGIESSFKHWCDDLCLGLWIQELAKNNKIHQINNDYFHVARHANQNEIETAITFHKVMDEEHYSFYANILDNEILNEKNN